MESKVIAAEATVKALTRERDSANYQISIMNETGEDLLDKIQLLEEQRDDFKRKWVALEKRYEQESQEWKSKPAPKIDILPLSGSATKRIGTLGLFDESLRFVSGASSGPIRSASDIRTSEAIQKALELPEEDCDSECNNSTVLHHVVEGGNSLPQEVNIGLVEDQEPKDIQQSTGVTEEWTYVSKADVSSPSHQPESSADHLYRQTT